MPCEHADAPLDELEQYRKAFEKAGLSSQDIEFAISYQFDADEVE
jgi:hypothetical protein